MATRALTTRLKRLKRGIGTHACPDCGVRFDGFGELALCFEGDEGADQHREHCATCDRPLVLRLEFDSDVDLLT